MNSDLPKVLHHVAGAPLLHHAMQAGASLAPDQVVVVAGHGAEAVGIWPTKYCLETAASISELKRNPMGNGCGGRRLWWRS